MRQKAHVASLPKNGNDSVETEEEDEEEDVVQPCALCRAGRGRFVFSQHVNHTPPTHFWFAM